MVCRKPNIELHELPEERHRSDTKNNSFKNRAKNIVDNDEVNAKIHKTIKLLTLRGKCSIIQFWAPSSFGKLKSLQMVDQPFGLGIHSHGLCNYMSEADLLVPVDEECKEEDCVPIVCVIRRQLPEWTSGMTNYHWKKNPPQDCAIHGNLHGYLVLPVFDSITLLCVGVLELITSTKYLDCAYEVQEVHRTLKVDYKSKQNELDEIFKVLKDVCDTHKLPLVQTWTVSSRSSFVAKDKNIEMTCNSFSARCIGKVCMSTTGLPFYVKDLRFWQFREACREHHLLESKGVVGRALSSNASCFCPNVTKLREDEYSLVHNARINGLTSCYAIYLDSNEHVYGYILEFFLPVNMKEDSDLRNLVQMMKMQLKFSFVGYGELLHTNVIGLIPMEASQSSLTMMVSDANQRSYSKETIKLALKNPHRAVETNVQIDCINAQDQCGSGQASQNNRRTSITNTKEMDTVITSKNIIDVASGGKECISGESPASTQQKRKQRTDSLTSLVETSMNLRSYSVEILQQDLGDTQTTPVTNSQDEQDFSNGCPKKSSGAIIPEDDASSKKLDVVTRQKRACTKGRRKRKMDSVTLETIQQYFGKPIGEASERLGVCRSTLKRGFREVTILSWPTPLRNKRYSHFGLADVALLLVRVKRWICSSNHHGFSAMWWTCGKHNVFVGESNPSANISPKGRTTFGLIYFSHLTKEPDESIKMTPFSKLSRPNFGVYQAPLKKKVVNASDTSMVIVKATFKGDILKFQFPLTSGVSELKNQVALRLKLGSTRIHIKYMDEDDDLILISCDEDLCNLMSFSSSSVRQNTIKLIVQMADA